MPSIDQAKILIVATDGFEQSELLQPRKDLTDAGATVHVASPKTGEIKAWDEDDWGQTVTVDLGTDDANADDYDALVLPGGQINPDKLRTEQSVMDLIHRFDEQGKVIAAICHAPWLLIEAGLADRDRTHDELRVDQDRRAQRRARPGWTRRSSPTGTSSPARNPGDLDAFGRADHRGRSRRARSDRRGRVAG